MFCKTIWMKLAFINLRLFDDDPISGVNRTTDAVRGNDLSAEMKTYYEKSLINTAEPKMIHDQFGDKYPIPQGSGKKIQFRKYSPLPKASAPLTEGVTPEGKRLNVSTVEAELHQYGDWIGISDILKWTAIDNNLAQATKILGSQAGRTLDTVTREVLCGGTAKRLAPHSNGTAVDLRQDLTADCKLTPDLIDKASTDLKAMNTDTIDGSYVAIIHPYVAHDIRRSSEFIDWHKYARPEELYNGEIGKLGGVRFVENTEAKIIGPAVISDDLSRLTVKTAIESSTTSVVVNEELTTGTYADDAAIPVWINGVANTIVAITKGTGQSTLTVGTAITSLAAGSIICGKGAGKDGSAVFVTLFLGAHAYGTTELEGGGLRHIFKNFGSGGTSDPLEQRATCGWKACKTAERLVEAYMLRVESGSAYSAQAESN